MQVRSFIRSFLSLIFHIAALSIVFFAFIQIAQWYFYHRPILGVDFFNTATYSKFFSDYFHILPYGFKYFWHAGSPIAEDILITWFVAYSFFARIFPLVESIKFASLFFFAMLALFVYLASFRLSKNQFLSALITVLVILSANMYGSLVWGGSLPYFANQLLLPAVLWLIISYLQSGNRSWYFVAILAIGFSFLGHLASAGAFIFPGAALLLLFGSRARPIKFLHRIGEVALLTLIVHILANRITDRVFGLIFQILQGSVPSLGGSAAKVSIGSEGITVTGDADIIAFERGRFMTLFTDSHLFLFYLFAMAVALFVIGFIVDKHKKNVFGVLVWFLLVGYAALHVWLNAYGISFLSQAWYRAFWHFPIYIGLASAALIGYSYGVFGSFFKGVKESFFVVATIVSVGVLIFVFSTNDSSKTIQQLEARSSPASAHPEAINLVRNQKELDALKPKLVPSWLDANDRMYRLFTSDAQVTVWWNALYTMPLFRGYLEPPIGSGVMGNQFLLDQSLTGDGLVTNFKYEPETAKQMGLYYLDWYAVKYLEGGHLSKSANKALSSYLEDFIEKVEDIEVKGAYILYQTKSGKPEVWENHPQYLKYYQFKNELVTPILSGNNSKAIICFCDWAAYEGVIKSLSMNNINSQMLVTVFYDDKIDSIPLQDLSHFDGVIAINYKYSNRDKAFLTLLKYVENGGKLYIDTGTEVAESSDKNLPDIFPFKSSERKGLGKNWKFSITEDPLFENVDLESFSPPLYNQSEWSFSYPTSGIDSSSEILLKNYGKPLLIRKEVGRGTVLWSGMNFSYHVHSYTNQKESILFINALKSLVPLSQNKVTLGKPTFIDDRHVMFSLDSKSRGILFKEQFFDGWNVSINGKQVKAYKAGPIFPGFVYAPIINKEGPITAEFIYWGRFNYHYLPRIIATIFVIILFDLIIFRGFFISRRLYVLSMHINKRVRKWWQREEE